MEIQTALFLMELTNTKIYMEKNQDWSILSLRNKYEDLFCQIPQFTEAKAVCYHII